MLRISELIFRRLKSTAVFGRVKNDAQKRWYEEIHKDKECQIYKLYSCFISVTNTRNRKKQKEEVSAGFYLSLIKISATIYKSQMFYI